VKKELLKRQIMEARTDHALSRSMIEFLGALIARQDAILDALLSSHATSQKIMSCLARIEEQRKTLDYHLHRVAYLEKLIPIKEKRFQERYASF
jgi:hypothetical protein